MTRDSPLLWLPTLAVVALGYTPIGLAQPATNQSAPQKTGADLYRSACAACHGSDGQGAPPSAVGFETRILYWQASVRRETLDHPDAAAEFEDACAVCHMPMARAHADANGRKGQVFAHLPAGAGAAAEDRLAHDGVSCTMCHQITDKKLGTAESFTGGFVVDAARSGGTPWIFGPFKVDAGRTTIMRSSSGFAPMEASHMRQSELCATCHTLYTQAVGSHGAATGRLPEQTPYLEWGGTVHFWRRRAVRRATCRASAKTRR